MSPVLIAGGGVGGLALAMMLHGRGIACEVLEAATEIRQLGVGINTLPHAIRELAALGLLPALDRVAVRTRELRYLNRFGQLIRSEPRGLHAGHDMPQFSIHRGRLHALMWEEALRRLPTGAIRTGMRLESVSAGDERVLAHFANGEAIEGVALVGADGIHSAVRRQLHPSDGGIRWNGIQMWRGAVDWPSFEGGDCMIVAGDMREKLVLYPIGEGAAPGTRLTNWVVCAQLGDGTQPPPAREDWSRPGRLSDVLPHVQRFRVPWLDVESLVRATPEFWEYPMCDRDPLPGWTQGRVTLLGDAAHPMYPVGSNGASQAVLDARCLADALAGQPVPEALAGYEAARLALTRDIVLSNRRGGPERVVDVVGERAPDGFADLDSVIRPAELDAISRGYAAMTSSLR